MTENENLKYLEMIQAIVTRMAQNSFMIKGWAVTVVAALLALAADDKDLSAALLAIGPALVFGGLDAYYLALERRFRRLYDVIRVQRPDAIPEGDRFSLDISGYVAAETVTAAFLRPAVWPLYTTLLVIILGVAGRFYGSR